MIKAVLLDLDNTLLRNSDEVFVLEYLHLIDEYIALKWEFPNMSQVLLRGIRALAGPRDWQHTNGDIVLQAITTATARASEEIVETFAGFYREAYPALQRCVQAIPEAADLVQHLRENQYAVVIATNPLYPPEAIRQRLAWAGLPDSFDQYALVTHSQNMHFTKPNPAYYAEVVARVGVEPDEAIMVGDNLDNDIRPAAQVGLHTYLIADEDSFNSEINADGRGALHDFYVQRVTQRWLDTLAPLALMPTMIEPELRGNVGALFGMLAEVKPHHWTQHPDPNEWSILQVVCHLFASEEQVQRPRLIRILEEDNPFLVAPKPSPGPHDPASVIETDGMRVARRFAEARHETLTLLQGISPAHWKRPARHSIFGPTSLLEMAHFTAQHDRLHLNQLCQTLGRCT